MEAAGREEELKKLALAFCANPRRTAKELAEAAGISKATFYRVYSSRDNLSRLLNEKAWQVIGEVMDSLEEKGKGSREKLHRAIGLCCENREYLMLLCYGTVTGSCDMSCQEMYRQKMQAFFLKGQSEGVFRIDISASAMAELFAGTMWSLFEGECRGRIASADMAAYWEHFFLQGVAIEKKERTMNERS